MSKERDLLRRLVEYGGHDVGCPKSLFEADPGDCDCGYDTVLDAARALLTEPEAGEVYEVMADGPWLIVQLDGNYKMCDRVRVTREEEG